MGVTGNGTSTSAADTRRVVGALIKASKPKARPVAPKIGFMPEF